MVIAVISDTHLPRGRRRIPDACLERMRDADLILHAGDFSDGLGARRARGARPAGGGRARQHRRARRAAPASRPRGWSRPAARGSPWSTTPGRRPAGCARLRTRFADASVDAVVFGHSHIPLHERDDDGFQIFNPGSPTDRRRQPRHTMGVAARRRRRRALRARRPRRRSASLRRGGSISSSGCARRRVVDLQRHVVDRRSARRAAPAARRRTRVAVVARAHEHVRGERREARRDLPHVEVVDLDDAGLGGHRAADRAAGPCPPARPRAARAWRRAAAPSPSATMSAATISAATPSARSQPGDEDHARRRRPRRATRRGR